MKGIKQAGSSRVSHFSPWLLGTAGLLLALIISVFAVNNYRREKVVMGKVLEQEGLAILNITSSAARGAMRDLAINGDLGPETWIDSIQKVIAHGSEHQQVVALFLVDDKGTVLAHTDPDKQKTSIDKIQLQKLEDLVLPPSSEESTFMTVEVQKMEVFQIAVPFRLMMFRNQRMMGGAPGHKHGMRMSSSWGENSELGRLLEELRTRRFYLVAQLDMSEYRSSVKKQLIQIIVLSIVLLLVGVGGFFSMITLQGF